MKQYVQCDRSVVRTYMIEKSAEEYILGYT